MLHIVVQTNNRSCGEYVKNTKRNRLNLGRILLNYWRIFNICTWDFKSICLFQYELIILRSFHKIAYNFLVCKMPNPYLFIYSVFYRKTNMFLIESTFILCHRYFKSNKCYKNNSNSLLIYISNAKSRKHYWTWKALRCVIFAHKAMPTMSHIARTHFYTETNAYHNAHKSPQST